MTVILIHDLKVGKFYSTARFPNVKLQVLKRTDIGIEVLRLSPLPVKNLRFLFSEFNTGKGGSGPAGVPFIEINL